MTRQSQLSKKFDIHKNFGSCDQAVTLEKIWRSNLWRSTTNYTLATTYLMSSINKPDSEKVLTQAREKILPRL